MNDDEKNQELNANGMYRPVKHPGRPKGRYIQQQGNGTGVRCFNGWSREGALRWNTLMEQIEEDREKNGKKFDMRMIKYAQEQKMSSGSPKRRMRLEDEEPIVLASNFGRSKLPRGKNKMKPMMETDEAELSLCLPDAENPNPNNPVMRKTSGRI